MARERNALREISEAREEKELYAPRNELTQAWIDRHNEVAAEKRERGKLKGVG